MNEEALKTLYSLGKERGYSKSFDEFKLLMSSNNEAVNTMYNVSKNNGYTKTIDDFKVLVGNKKQQADSNPVKKKGSTKPSSQATKPSKNPWTDQDLTGGSDPKQKTTFTAPLKREPQNVTSKNPYKEDLDRAQGKFVPDGPARGPMKDLATKDPYSSNESDWKQKTTFTAPLKSESKNEEAVDPYSGTILSNKDNKDPFYKSLKSLDDNLLSNSEEFLVPKLNYEYGQYGFTFEESGIGHNAMNITASNGKTLNINVGTFFGLGKSEEAPKVRKFLDENKVIYEKVNGSISKLKKNDQKIADESEIIRAVRVLNDQSEYFERESKELILSKKKSDNIYKENNFESLTREKLDANPELKKKYDLWLKENELFQQKLSKLKSKELQIIGKGQKLDYLAGKYNSMKSKQGNALSGLWNSLTEGQGSITASASSMTLDLLSSSAMNALMGDDWGYGMGKSNYIMAKNEAKAKYSTYLKTLSKEDGEKFIHSKVIDKARKETKYGKEEYDNPFSNVASKADLKKGVVDYSREGLRDIMGDSETTEQWMRLKEEGFWYGAISGLVKSIPAMTGNFAQRTALMYAQISDNINKEMQDDPAFKNVSENEKYAISVPVGIAGGVLESFGFRNIVGQKGLLNSVLAKAIGQSTKKTSAKSFSEFIKRDVESRLARGVLTITGAGLAEFETGFAQNMVEASLKDIYNLSKGKDLFKTPDTFLDLVKESVYSGAQEAVGGFVMGIPGAVSAAVTERKVSQLDNTTFDIFEEMSKDENYRKMYVAKLKAEITDRSLTVEEAQDNLSKVDLLLGLLPEIPSDYTTKQKKTSLELLYLKKEIEKDIVGKDKNLVVNKQKELDEVNEKLEGVSSMKSEAETDIEKSELDVDERINELESMLAGDAASMEKTGQGELIPEAREEVVSELESLKKTKESTAKSEPTSETTNDNPYEEASDFVVEGIGAGYTVFGGDEANSSGDARGTTEGNSAMTNFEPTYRESVNESGKKVFSYIVPGFREHAAAGRDGYIAVSIAVPQSSTATISDFKAGLKAKAEEVISANTMKEGRITLNPNVSLSKPKKQPTPQTSETTPATSATEATTIPDVKVVAQAGINEETSSNFANLTEDADGNFVFFHRGKKGYDKVKKSSGTTKGSKSENIALGKIGGAAMYYTDQNDSESMVDGPAQYSVKVSPDKVYDTNSDPLGFYEEAKAMHEAEFPGQAFDLNTQFSYMTKVAGEKGFDMVVGQWGDKTRAQTTSELAPNDSREFDGNVMTKDFSEKYIGNRDKGYEAVIPESKFSKLKSVYDKINAERNKEERYDDLYRLSSSFENYTPEQITTLINESDISNEIKEEYNEILAEPVKGRSTYKGKTGTVKVDNIPKGTFLNIGLEVGGKKVLTEANIIDALPSDVKILNKAEIKKEGGKVDEDTMSLEISRELTDYEMARLRSLTKQDGIPQISNGSGTMYGNMSAISIWGDFNPDYFVMPDGRKTNEYKAVETKSIKESASELSKKIRSLKAPIDLRNLSSSPKPIFDAAWNTTLEAIARAVEAGGTIAEAVAEGIKALKNSKWYDSLSNDGKKSAIQFAEKSLTDDANKLLKDKESSGPTSKERRNKIISGIESKIKSRNVGENTDPKKILKAAIAYFEGSKEYKEMDSTERESVYREIRKRFGAKEKSAPSAKRILGKLKDIKNITISEMVMLKKQIMDANRGAKDLKKAQNESKKTTNKRS